MVEEGGEGTREKEMGEGEEGDQKEETEGGEKKGEEKEEKTVPEEAIAQREIIASRYKPVENEVKFERSEPCLAN